MGSRLVKVGFTPEENEQIEVAIKVPEETRSIIHGVVKDSCDRIIENAVVELYEQENQGNPCLLRPITHTFTDECGQFLFGPLAAGKHYVIKVWVNDVNTRRLIIKANDEDGECEIEKMEDRIEDTKDIIITRSDEPGEEVKRKVMPQPVSNHIGKPKTQLKKPGQP